MELYNRMLEGYFFFFILIPHFFMQASWAFLLPHAPFFLCHFLCSFAVTTMPLTPFLDFFTINLFFINFYFCIYLFVRIRQYDGKDNSMELYNRMFLLAEAVGIGIK
jgi:hypothetical protein